MYYEHQPLTRNINQISKIFWADYVRESGSITMIERGEKIWNNFYSFTGEIYHRLYCDPEAEKLETIAPENQWADKFHEEFEQLDEFKFLVYQCEGDPLASGIATSEFSTGILSRMPKPNQPIEDVESLREQVENLKHKPDSPQKQKQLEKLIQRGKQAVENAQQYAAHLDDTHVCQVLRYSANQASKAVDEAKKKFAALGISWGNELGSRQRLPVNEKLKLAHKIRSNERLKKLLELAGRMKQAAERKRRTKSVNGLTELVGVTVGNDLNRLLPSELQKLAEPATEDLFYLGYYDRTLLEYEIKGKETQVKGPVIVCTDVSGSMKGQPDEWAKALTLTFAFIAREDKRWMKFIQFSHDITQSDEFDPHQSNPEQLIESVAGHYCGGGTNFNRPLNCALDCLKKHEQFKRGDIVFISDGECNINSQTRERFTKLKEELGFTCYGILVMPRSNITSEQRERLKKCTTNHSMNDFCDRLYIVTDLASSDQVEQIFTI